MLALFSLGVARDTIQLVILVAKERSFLFYFVEMRSNDDARRVWSASLDVD